MCASVPPVPLYIRQNFIPYFHELIIYRLLEKMKTDDCWICPRHPEAAGPCYYNGLHSLEERSGWGRTPVNDKGTFNTDILNQTTFPSPTLESIKYGRPVFMMKPGIEFILNLFSITRTLNHSLIFTIKTSFSCIDQSSAFKGLNKTSFVSNQMCLFCISTCYTKS